MASHRPSFALVAGDLVNGHWYADAGRFETLGRVNGVAGMRLAVSFGVSSLAVYLLGPTVKAAGFGTLLVVMALISAFTTLCVLMLPGRVPSGAPASLAVAPVRGGRS